MTTLQDVRRLEDEFAEAMDRMYTVGNGLAGLRAQLDREDRTAPAAPTTVPSGHATPRAAALPPGPAMPPAGGPTAATPRPAPAPRPHWWQREGMVIRALVLAGAVVTLAGVVMLLAVAIQHGWFGPTARIVAGGLLAVILVAAGHLVRAREARDARETAAPVVVATTGYAAAYLDIIATTTVYDVVPAVVGLAIAVLVAGSGLLVARRWASQILAVGTVAGAAVLGPVVAGQPSWVLSAFLLVLATAFAPLHLSRAWPALDAARTLSVTIGLLVGSAASAPASLDHRVHVLLAALLAALAIVTAARHRGPDAATSGAAVLSTVLAGLAALPLLVGVGILDRAPRTVGLLVMAAAYLVLSILAGRGRIIEIPGHLRAMLASTGTLALVLAIVSGAPAGHVGTGLLVAATAYLALAGATRSRLSLALGTGVGLLAGVGYLTHVVAITTPRLATEDGPGTALLDSTVFALLLVVLGWSTAGGRLPEQVRPLAVPVLWLGGLAVSATLSVSVGLLVGRPLGEDRAGFLAGHALATLTWVAEALWLLAHGLGRAKDSGLALRVGLVLAAVGVAKLFLFDLAALSGLWRAAAFLGAGVLLLAAGTGYARALERSRAAARPAL